MRRLHRCRSTMPEKKRSDACSFIQEKKPWLLWVFSRSDAMTFLTPTPVQAGVDGSLSDLLAHWMKEQFQQDEPTRRERPSIGIIAAGGTLRDGGWPIYGGDAPTVHAIL